MEKTLNSLVSFPKEKWSKNSQLGEGWAQYFDSTSLEPSAPVGGGDFGDFSIIFSKFPL